MTDWETVMSRLEELAQDDWVLNFNDNDVKETAKAALELLKEQEAQSVLSNRVCEAELFRYVRKGFCPKCHQEMEWLFNRKYCGFCGQAVKWE